MNQAAPGTQADTTQTNAANPNGYIPIVFTYGGQAFTSYQAFLDSFYLTLPGGNGVQLGANQYYGYSSDSSNTVSLGQSYPLSSAASPITGLLPTNAVGNTGLAQAFSNWAANQAASSGQTAYANLYLSQYTGGRVYLSNGNLQLSASGEPTPAAPTDLAYDIVYDIFEPYIGAQVGSTTIAGNLADITDVDWFSFPVTLKVWSYDFTGTPGALSCSGSGSSLNGGNGSAIWQSLLIPTGGDTPSNQYPSTSFPATDGNTSARRVAAPTMAAAGSYYSDPTQNPFPYSFLDGYLRYLQQAQGSNASLFTLNGSFAGVGSNPTQVQLQAQTFSLAIDFSAVQTASYTYPSGNITQITPTSQLVLRGYTSLLGSAASPFEITLPWAVVSDTYALRANPTIAPANDALAQGWLSLQGSTPTAPSFTYSPVNVTAQDSTGAALTPTSGQAQMQLIYSVNSQPLSGQFDDLYQGGSGDWLTLTGTTGLTCTVSATYTQQASCGAVLTITTNSSGGLDTIKINDVGTSSPMAQGTQWVIPSAATGLGNNQSFTVTLAGAPLLRNAFMLSSATYTTQPATVLLTPASGDSCTLQVNSAGLITSFLPNTEWTTLSQPAGIYGANAGYVISGLTGANAGLNGNVLSLQNDVFGWAVADLLAALNAGLVGSPAPWSNGKTVGNSPDDWFIVGNNPYTEGVWGAAAWAGQQWNGQAVNSFWNTWAWELYNVAGGTNAYNFAFTDRFESGVLIGFNPPPPSPSGLQPVLLEVIVNDSPALGIVQLQANQAWYDTGVDVASSGKTIQYLSGTWTADPQTNAGQQYDANGCPGLTVTQPAYPLTGVNMGALVARVGSNGVFLVGDGPTATPTGQTGRLYLCINDDMNHVYGAGLADNTGSIVVRVS